MARYLPRLHLFSIGMIIGRLGGKRRVPAELRLGHKSTVKGIYQKPQIAYPMEKIFKDLRIGKRVEELVKKW